MSISKENLLTLMEQRKEELNVLLERLNVYKKKNNQFKIKLIEQQISIKRKQIKTISERLNK
jgi:hypothetical protein